MASCPSTSPSLHEEHARTQGDDEFLHEDKEEAEEESYSEEEEEEEEEEGTPIALQSAVGSILGGPEDWHAAEAAVGSVPSASCEVMPSPAPSSSSNNTSGDCLLYGLCSPH